jgi:WhiB family transcriptional regulator, redox-sensing transcriptional regulator
MKSNITELSSRPQAVPEINVGLPCQHENPRLWFSNLSVELKLAKVYCRRCPRRQPCLAGALERAEPTGVWGGEIFERGRIIESKRPPGRPRKATFGGDQR